MAELSLVVKATLVLALALCVTRLAGRASAAVSSLILACTFGLLILLPLVAATFPVRAIELPGSYSSALAPALDPSAASSPALPSAVNVSPISNVSDRSPSTHTVALSIWAAGVVGFAAPLAFGFIRVRRIRCDGRPWSHFSLSSPVALLLHDDLRVPITCGLVRPVIALPADAPQWSEPDMRRVLLHELEHVRRRDWPVHIAARAVCAFYWFHPLVWIAWRQLRLESERACDDAVLRQEDGAEYANQLVSLARRITRRDTLPMLSIAGRSNLSTRVAAMLAANVSRRRVSSAGASAVVCLALIAAFGIGPLQAVAVPREQAQSPASPFESASIRPAAVTDSARCCQVHYLPGGRIAGYDVDVVDLMASAYGIYRWQVVGAPVWAGGAPRGVDRGAVLHPATGVDRFDVQATARDNARPDEMRLALRSLLAERFRLAVHREQRQERAYELIVDPAGARLQPPGRRPYDVERDVWLNVDPANLMATLDVEQMTMTQLARNLGGILRYTVVDRTGLDGAYGVRVRWDANPNRPDVLQASAGAPRDPNRPTIFEAFAAQLGLRLRETTGPVEYLVVDRVERVR